MRFAQLALMAAVLVAGCGSDATCDYSADEVELQVGQVAPEVPAQLIEKYPGLRQALQGDGRGATGGCPNRPMMEDVLSLGGTGQIFGEVHGWALVSRDGTALNLTWTGTHGGEL